MFQIANKLVQLNNKTQSLLRAKLPQQKNMPKLIIQAFYDIQVVISYIKFMEDITYKQHTNKNHKNLNVGTIHPKICKYQALKTS